MPRFKNPADNQYYQGVRAAFRAAGLSRAQLDQAVTWYGELKPGLSRQQLSESFQQFAAARGWDEANIERAQVSYDQVATYGPDRVIGPSNDASDQQIISRAEEAMQSDFAAYSRDADLQEDYQAALERAEARGSLPGQTRPTEPDGPVTTSPVYREAVRGSDTRRRGEIETAMREDGGRKYWSDPAMQAEFADILGRQVTAPSSMDPGSVGTDANARPSGGSEATGGATVNGF